MNILFIGPYRHGVDGWGNSSVSLIKSLATTEHNLSIRPIYMANKQCHLQDPLLLELENNKYENYDCVIQNVLPHLVDYQPKLGKNIAYFHLETSHLEYTSWVHHCNLMDEIWVTSLAEQDALEISGVKVPIRKTSQAVDLKKFNKEYEPLFDKDGNFVFYFIGEFIERKGLTELLLAYFSTFHRHDKVLLIIKTLGEQKNIQDFIQNIQQRLSLYKDFWLYPQVKVINQALSEEDLNRLHSTCDCFVMPSYGESVCLPILDAMGFGNPSIVTDKTGMTDFVDETCGFIISSEKEPVNTLQRPLADLYTGYETWYRPSVMNLSGWMQTIFTTKTSYEFKSKKCKEKIKEFSYKNIGKELSL